MTDKNDMNNTVFARKQPDSWVLTVLLLFMGLTFSVAQTVVWNSQNIGLMKVGVPFTGSVAATGGTGTIN